MAEAKKFPRYRSKSIIIRKTRNQPDQSIFSKAANSLRFRRASDSPATTSRRNSTDANGVKLSATQITLVRKLWQQVRVQGENGSGLSILRDHLFFQCPSARRLFATDMKGNQSEMWYHKRLMLHAETLSEMLDELVTNLERPEKVQEKLKCWGGLHAHMRHVGFESSFWDRFAESLNNCTLTWCRKAQRCFDAQVAWTTITMYVTEQLKDGYYEECKRVRRQMYSRSKYTVQQDIDRSPAIEGDRIIDQESSSDHVDPGRCIWQGQIIDQNRITSRSDQMINHKISRDNQFLIEHEGTEYDHDWGTVV